MKSEVVDFQHLQTSMEVGHGGKTKQLGDALDEALSKVARAVATAGGKGALTLKLSIEMDGRNEFSIGAEITTKCPEPKAFKVRVYADRRGNLVADDPEQGRLPLEAVEESA